jgi:hypothetical protein
VAMPVAWENNAKFDDPAPIVDRLIARSMGLFAGQGKKIFTGN